MKRPQRIDHTTHCDPGKKTSGDTAGFVVGEVKETDGEAAKEDGEVEPGEEGAFVGEEDFGFDADGEGDAFCWGGGEEGLGGHCS